MTLENFLSFYSMNMNVIHFEIKLTVLVICVLCGHEVIVWLVNHFNMSLTMSDGFVTDNERWVCHWHWVMHLSLTVSDAFVTDNGWCVCHWQWVMGLSPLTTRQTIWESVQFLREDRGLELVSSLTAVLMLFKGIYEKRNWWKSKKLWQSQKNSTGIIYETVLLN